MRKKEKIFFWLMIATSVFWCVAYWQSLLPTEEWNSETINYWQDNQQDQPERGYQQNKSDGEIVVPYSPEESNSPEAQELKKQQQQQEQQEQQQTKEECKDWCCGIKLNTNFPIIWNCIETKKDASTNPTNAFPMMMWVITQIVVSLILVVCFILIIVAWVKRASDDPKWWKELLQKVAITVILLWLTWVILKAINPVFFS